MKKYKIISMIILICIITTLIPEAARAVSVKDSLTTVTSDTADAELFTLPDIIESEEATEKGYIGRVKTAEKDLNTFVFRNSDGTRTMRVFSHPVKYIADDGSVQDISLDVKAKNGGGFVSANHEIVTVFADKLSGGVSLSYDDIDITMVPALAAGKNPVGTLAGNNRVVTYNADSKTSYVYELTYAGYKEDIVVKEYTGQTEYAFKLYTNGLTLVEECGSFYLADANGAIKASIGDIIVFTEDERNNTLGSMTYDTVTANQEYVLTIHLDSSYLSHEDTVYPIRIDPTIEINYDNNGAGAIQDVTIHAQSTYSGTSGSLYVGRHTSGYLSRALMRFPNLSLNGILASRITAASVELRDLMCQDDEDITIDCHIYNKNSPAWSESGTTTWSSVGSSYLGTLLDSHLVSYGRGNAGSQRYSFNILTAAKAWANGTQSPAKGLVFKASSSFENQTGTSAKKWYKTFASYNRSSYKPSLSITYQGTVNIWVNETHLPVGGTKQVSCSTDPSGLSVTWSTNDSSVATVSSTGLVTGISEGTVRITATYTDTATGTTASDIVFLHVKDSVGITNNTVYYIMNVNSQRFLSLESASDSNSTNVYTRARSTSTLSRWKVEKQSNATYQLVSSYSSSGKVLNASGTNINIYTDNNSTNQKFSIYRVNSGVYEGSYCIMYKQYYVAQDSNYNVYLTTSYSNSAIWSFIPYAKGDAEIFSFNHNGFNTTGNNALFCTVLGNLAYDDFAWTNGSASTAYGSMRNTDSVFVFRGHGNAGLIAFQDSSGVSTGAISVNAAICSRYSVGTNRRYIENLSKNELSKLRAVLYIGCSTGETIVDGGEEYDLLTSTYKKGAKFVLGTNQTVYTRDSNAFLEGFLKALSENKNIYSCIQDGLVEAGDQVLHEDGTLGRYPVEYIGDVMQYLNY